MGGALKLILIISRFFPASLNEHLTLFQSFYSIWHTVLKLYHNFHCRYMSLLVQHENFGNLDCRKFRGRKIPRILGNIHMQDIFANLVIFANFLKFSRMQIFPVLQYQAYFRVSLMTILQKAQSVSDCAGV